MTMQIATGQNIGRSSGLRGGKRWPLVQRRPIPASLIVLLLCSGLFEVAGDIVYVTLMERTFDLGGGAAAVGVFLVLQAVGQLLLGPIIGSLADILGARRAAIFGLIGLASLSLGLAESESIWLVYLLALHLTMARLFVLTSRVPLVSTLSTRAGYLGANSALSVLEGVGLLLGPSIAAGLILIWHDPKIPLLVSAVLFVVAAVLLMFRMDRPDHSAYEKRSTIFVEVREGWRHILSHRPIWEVLVCLTISGLTFGAVMPMLTLLARQTGLGSEGSGIYVAALGLGWLLGPFAVGPLVRRLSYTRALLATGIATPLAALTIGFLPTVGSIVVALTLAAFAAAALQVIVTTIVQRLTPENIQGSVMGTQRALSGLIWILSATAITIALALAPSNADPRIVFYPLGVIGTLLVLGCWSFGRRTLVSIIEGMALRVK